VTGNLDTSTVRLTHHVWLRHASTGAAIRPVTAQVDALPHGWSLRVRGADIIVSARVGAPVPAAVPTLTVSVADPRLARLIQTPSVDVPLNAAPAAAIVIDIPPVSMTLAIKLIAPSTGTPSAGRTVTARATSGPTPRPSISLTQVAPGLYESGPVLWTAAFTPLELLVDGNLLRQVSVDFNQTETRVQLLDTT
jgi:hypothetical protein